MNYVHDYEPRNMYINIVKNEENKYRIDIPCVKYTYRGVYL